MDDAVELRLCCGRCLHINVALRLMGNTFGGHGGGVVAVGSMVWQRNAYGGFGGER